MQKRTTFALFAAAAVVVAAACGTSAPPEKFKQKLVILGFDGMEPTLVQKWMGEGKLPNFKKLSDQGGFYRLQTTTSPESPVSWASFATGSNAAKHNIFDFLVRNVKTYFPDYGLVEREYPKFLFDYIPISRAKITSIRGGTSWWVTAGQAGVRSSVLTVPITFPPEDVPNGEMLSGLPMPDIRGTQGTFYYFATDLSRYEEGNTEMGGILKRLAFDGDVARSELVGPPNPIILTKLKELHAKGSQLSDAERQRVADLEAKRDITIPFSVRWNRQDRSATIDLQDTQVRLAEGEWSKWIPVEFRINFLARVYGMLQVYIVKASGDLQIYMSPINWRPESPLVPMSSPASLSKDLYERLGTYRTLGWAEATWPLNEDRIDEKAFMDDLFRAFDDRAQVILHEIDTKKFDVVVGVLESTDRVQHMFWRYIDPTHPMYDAAAAAKYGDSIERVYKRCDQLLGEVLQRVTPDTLVMVVSDHGFHSFKQAVNLNTWLVEQGYIARPGNAGDKNLNDLFGGGGQFWENVDWSRTKAYSLGLGQIYFNMKGREGQGIVNQGAEYKQLADELAARLLTMTDPKTGARMVSAVYKRDDVYSGPYIKNAPDLQVGFADGYRVSWQTSLGGTPPGLVYPNMKKWSGDHCSFDAATIPGSLLINRKLTADSPRIIDIAPTVLKYFGIDAPKDMDGKALF